MNTEHLLPAMTALGEDLASEDGIAKRDQLYKTLHGRRDQLKASLAGGLPPDQAQATESEIRALDAAERIVASISFFHQRAV
jgi:hypothetical protein